MRKKGTESYTIDLTVDPVPYDQLVDSHIRWVQAQRQAYPQARIGIICNTVDKVFFDSKEYAVEVRAKVIYGEGEGDIITQYVMFCKVLKEQVKLHGMTRKALRETIRLCKDLGVLREYLEKREVEVMDIMTMLFDQETVTNTYINDVLRQGRAEGRKEGNLQGFVNACRDFGVSRDEAVARVARMFDFSEADARVEVSRYWTQDS